MQAEHTIISEVLAAKQDARRADDFIRAYIPFIRAEASKCISRPCSEQDDEFSIAMIAFHEAILGYEKTRGAFLSYASLCIRSRIADFARKERRHAGHISADEEFGEEGGTLLETLSDGRDHFDERDTREATQREIAELASVMADFGVNFSDVAENCPKQERTLRACMAAVRAAVENRHLLSDMLRTKKLPLAQLCLLSKTERKTLERHRKYILALLLIQTNGYEIIRGHLRRMLGRKGETA